MTEQDIDDIENRLPFVLTSDEIPEYNILYVGLQQQDELHCYVFDVAPKEIVGKKRYFQGPCLGRRPRLSDREELNGKTVPDIRPKKEGQQREPVPQLPPPGEPRSMASIGSPSTRKGGRPAAFFRWATCTSARS